MVDSVLSLNSSYTEAPRSGNTQATRGKFKYVRAMNVSAWIQRLLQS